MINSIFLTLKVMTLYHSSNNVPSWRILWIIMVGVTKDNTVSMDILYWGRKKGKQKLTSGYYRESMLHHNALTHWGQLTDVLLLEESLVCMWNIARHLGKITTWNKFPTQNIHIVATLVLYSEHCFLGLLRHTITSIILSYCAPWLLQKLHTKCIDRLFLVLNLKKS